MTPEDAGAEVPFAAPESGPEPTARDRRRARVRARERRALPKKGLQIGGAILAAALVIAGIVWAIQLLPEAPKTIHWHAALKMFNEDEEISFKSCAFDLNPCQGFQGTGFARGHLHVSERPVQVVHIEGLEGLTLGIFFESIGVQVGSEKVVLDQVIHGGRSFPNNGTHTWQFWVNHCQESPDTWALEPRFQKYQPRQHDRMLAIYSNQTALAAHKAKMDLVPSDANIASVGGDVC